MLNNVSEQVRNAYVRAQECARKARLAASEEIRQDYLALEGHWLALARSCELTERVASFTSEAKRRQAHNQQKLDGHSGDTIVPFLRTSHDAFDHDVTRIMGEAFDAACKTLGEISPAARESVAGRIIMAAKHGERDPIRLRDTGIEAVRPRDP